ncbi:hypothetical protein F2Q70_00016187 [Brassica cretica]|uniref:Uncharacterized protein n=1 Tax=Brassica cretica TaxID=69181 RepID=A0A8S9I0R6_BRACR|nr:hypothetical protein F2Q70_00016187 [Brassica cretica]KAF2600504.1 hypothetical protein F2Q68_00009170 [Brassica cretica]
MFFSVDSFHRKPPTWKRTEKTTPERLGATDGFSNILTTTRLTPAHLFTSLLTKSLLTVDHDLPNHNSSSHKSLDHNLPDHNSPDHNSPAKSVHNSSDQVFADHDH